MEQANEGFDLRHTLTALRRRAWLILLCAMVAGGAAFAFSSLQENRYTASAQLLFRDPGFDQSIFGGSTFQASNDPARDAKTNVELVSLPVVSAQTAKDVGAGLTPEDVEDRVEISEAGDSSLTTVAATDAAPRLAARIANNYARNYVDFRRKADQRKVGDAVELVQQKYDALTPEARAGQQGQSLEKEISNLTTLQALQTGNAELVQSAKAPTSPSSPKPVRDSALGVVLGLILGVGLALLRERLDRRINDPKELEERFELPLLGAVPESGAFSAIAAERNGLPFMEAEAFRMMRTRLQYFNVDRDIRSVIVTSSAPAEGKTTVAWHLAYAGAASGLSVLLIEADLHNQAIAASTGLAPMPGLAEVLTHQSGRLHATQRVPAGTSSNGARAESDRHLDVLVGGVTPPNPAELLESTEMRRLIETASESYDLVVLDTPPAAVLADAIPLMTTVDGVIVVSRVGRTTREEVTHLRDELRKLRAPTLGVVANRLQEKRGRYGYGYYGSYEGKAVSSPDHMEVGSGNEP